MKKKSWLFYLSLCSLFLFACQDEEESIIIPPDNTDSYEGTHNVVTLHDETEDFHYSDFICALSTENGTVISREGEHLRLDGKSILTFDTGLKAGTYRLLYLKSPVVESAEADTTWVEYGLGCRIEISEGVDTVKVLDAYSKAMQLSGQGTEKDPFIVSSSDHLKRIRKVTNDQIKNNLLLENTHFLQTTDIDMYTASEDADFEFGWLPIGSQPTNPFRGIYDGGGHTIRNLWAKRSQSGGIALFGFATTAVFKNIRLENPKIEGHYAVGSLLGASVSAGNKREKTILLNCSTNNA